MGNDLPFGLHRADSVPYGDSFVLVGGELEDPVIESGAILLYKPRDNSWAVMARALKTRRADAKAITVRRSMFPQC